MKKLLTLLLCACLLCAALCSLSYATDAQTDTSTAATETASASESESASTTEQGSAFTKTVLPQSASFAMINPQYVYGSGSLSIEMPEQHNATSYSLYWGDASGQRLLGYAPFFSGKITSKDIYETVSDGFSVPFYAKCVLLYTYSEEFGQSEQAYRMDLPVLPEIKLGKKVLEFAVVSDLHIGSGEQAEANLLAMLKDVTAAFPDAQGVYVTGDAVAAADPAYYTGLKQLWSSVKGAPSLFQALGERELTEKDAVIVDSTKYNANLTTFLSNLNTPTDVKPTTPYYSFMAGDYLMIFVGADMYQGGKAYYSEAQLTWLSNTLNQADAYEPVFIFMHQPLTGTVSGTTSGQNYTTLGNSDQLSNIIKKHANAIVFSGHTQLSMEELRTNYTYPNGARYYNVAGIANLTQEKDGALEPITGSQGYIVTVYENYVMIRGRDFSYGGQWISNAYFLFSVKPVPQQSPTSPNTTPKVTQATTSAEEAEQEEEKSFLRELALPLSILGVMGIIVFLWVFRKTKDSSDPM